MNLKRWFFLFWSCMLIGAAVSITVGLMMQWTDQSFGFMGLEATGFNALMMGLAGLLIGAFSQMGFFAYLSLNYVALGVLRRQYLWTALQAYTTVFALFVLGYILYMDRGNLNGWMFWALPLALAAASWLVAFVKVKKTNATAFVPTMFLMVVVTSLEAWPAIRGDSNAAAIVFMMAPLFVCNAYQILMLHRLVASKTAESAAKAESTV
ncbi:KinB signaling pathway activation protein [Paenibacillus sp. 32O-W]|uniref:KinB-signaling pathway activation protein n=1 Tax=Paenibacillus sp. 32O-W TaxID=1695218 RepID=UPI0007208399|nr:KinB-signaling pathway activation protein [Paenibacillus sp. 32O-W]ALS26211.1 KinB signaling pathway activation protein [Paenibacillus sp. 32O-W]